MQTDLTLLHSEHIILKMVSFTNVYFTKMKPLQYCKVTSLQLIKINGKKRKKIKRMTM